MKSILVHVHMKYQDINIIHITDFFYIYYFFLSLSQTFHSQSNQSNLFITSFVF